MEGVGKFGLIESTATRLQRFTDRLRGCKNPPKPTDYHPWVRTDSGMAEMGTAEVAAEVGDGRGGAEVGTATFCSANAAMGMANATRAPQMSQSPTISG